MATTDNTGYVTLEMLHKMAKQPIFRRTTITRPLSEATEIVDTDFESDYDNSYDDDSSRRSVASLVADSVTTADTPRDVPTPDNGGALSSFHFHFDEKPIMGPNGPHLFRSSMSSDEMNNSYEVDFMLAKTPTAAFFDQALTQQRKDTPLPGFEEVPESTPQVQQLKSINAAVSALDETEVRSWSPPDVVRWMQEVGFDDSVVEKFFINDISGAILLDLQVEDLKELDIQSFGKRRHLMNSIQHLRASIMLPNHETHTSFASRDHISSDCTSSSESASTPTRENKKKHRRHRHHRSHKKDSNAHKDLIPEDSASIVAIEQFLPKPHYCSKGEDCRKWQKQQRKIARLAKDLPIDIEAAQRLMLEDHEDQPLPTSKSLPNMEPLPTPSIVASSDVLGPEQTPIFQISEEKLNEICPRDPQENVRQYLNFQHLSRLQPVTQVDSKSQLCSSPEVDSPDSTRTTTSLADNLRSLPKLTIPVDGQTLVPGAFSASLSAQRTVTPSILRRQPNFVTNSIDGTLHSSHQQAMAYGSSFSPADFASPSDFYRSHDVYQQASPLSEVDVPVTAIPAGPIERLASQSVPPNMRFGHHLRVVPDPFVRSTSTKPDNYRSGPSTQILGPVDEAESSNDSIDVPMTAIPGGPVERTDSQSVPPNMRFGREFYVPADPIYRPASTKNSNYRYPSTVGSTLDRVDEVGPIDTVEDFANSSRTAPRSANDTTHSGWMRKRKTTKMLRHEWEDHHFTLKGTRLAMFEDERDSHRDSKALEYIDVDDYAVACSSLASNSKLTAAFKKTVLKRKPSAQDEAAFAFSLIPAANGKATAAERKNFFVSNGKSHHFAVKTRDERIDWMRELMLARALKKGKDSGDSVHVNGYLF